MYFWCKIFYFVVILNLIVEFGKLEFLKLSYIIRESNECV